MRLSLTLLAIIGIVFLLQQSIPGFTEQYYFDPLTALSKPWLFVTNIFLHGDITHILFNGYALFAFGTVLEQYMNKKQYLLLFFIAGVIGSVLYYSTYIFGLNPGIPALGASGAIYGILGALAILTPNLTVYLFYAPVPIKYAAILWIVLELVGTFNISSGIASAAHLGGLIFGLVYAFYLKSRNEVDWYE